MCVHELDIPEDAVFDYDIATLRDQVYEVYGIEPDQQLLLYERLLLPRNGSVTFNGRDRQLEIRRHRPPDREIIVSTSLDGEVANTAWYGDPPVLELKRMVARRYLVPPSRQVLATLGLTMADEDPLGTYSAIQPMEVTVTVVDDGEPSQLVLASVHRRDGRPGTVEFYMDARDTFDVLAGRMERAGMVAEGEKVTFISAAGNILFVKSRTFGDYQLTHARLRVLE